MSEAFGRALCSASAAQVVKNAGFAKASDSTVNTVGDLVTKYVEHVCVTAKEFCEHSQRTDANMVDVLLALKQVGTSSDHISQFVREQSKAKSKHEGFRWIVSNFPTKRNHNKDEGKSKGISLSSKSFDQVFEEAAEGDETHEPPKHIPGFLPTFPIERTYQSTEVIHTKEHDGHALWMQLQQQKQDAAEAVLNLESRIKEEKQEGESAEKGGGDAVENTTTNGASEEGFLPEQYSNFLSELHKTADRKIVKTGSRARQKNKVRAPSSLRSQPRRLNDLDAAQIKQVVYQSVNSSLLNDSKLLGMEQALSRQTRSKWQNFKSGGWKPEGVFEEENLDLQMDLTEREKLDKAEKILKFGVNAAEEELL